MHKNMQGVSIKFLFLEELIQNFLSLLYINVQTGNQCPFIRSFYYANTYKLRKVSFMKF